MVLLPGNSKYIPHRPPSFTQGHHSPLHLNRTTLHKEILAKISQSHPPHAEHTRPPTFRQRLQNHRHPQPLCCLIYCCLCWLGPPCSPSSCLTVDITFILTGLLSECPREKGKRAHCLVETTGIQNSCSWRSWGIYLDHHPIDILVLIFTPTFCLCRR